MKNALDRSVVIQQIYSMMRMCEYASVRISDLFAQFEGETNQNIINTFAMSCVAAESLYLPRD